MFISTSLNSAYYIGRHSELLFRLKLIIVSITSMCFSLIYSQSTNGCSTSGSGIPVGTSCTPTTFNLVESTKYWTSASGCFASSSYFDTWWHFTATSTSTTITYTPTGWDAILTLFSAACSPSMTRIACADNGFTGGAETITYATTPGTVYKVRIQRWSGTATDGTICVWSPAYTTSDCQGATQICNDESFSGNSSGAGNYVDLDATNQGCGTSEHQSSWYYFQVSSSGTFELEITTTKDYDFFIWGPDKSCASLGTPIRCSFASSSGNTGLKIGSGDVSEGSGGDRWLDALNGNVGEKYILLVDNFTADGSSFTLDWTFSGGAGLNCNPVPLPIELVDFKGYFVEGKTELVWNTASENNSDYFMLERSYDGKNFVELERMMAAGNSTTTLDYQYDDLTVRANLKVYYRLSSFDIDGDLSATKTICVSTLESLVDIISMYPIPTAQKLNLTIRTCKNDTGEISIFGSTGIRIKSVEYTHKEETPIQLDVLDLEPGIYYLRVNSNSGQFSETRRFIVQR